MKNQKGLTLTGLIVTSMIVVLVLILSFKIVPVYMEYFTIKRLFRSMAEDPALRSAQRSELNRAWAARTTIDNVRSLPGENIEYTKDANGLTVSAEYSVKVPVVHNISLYFDFHPTSN
jgi:Tfp pilus assembly protein PilE